MFDFEKLEVYKKARTFNNILRDEVIKTLEVDRWTRSQLYRAGLSILLNIAEGSGRFTNPDKKNFYVIARGSVFECVALVDFLETQKVINHNDYRKFYYCAEELSKMLYAMIRKLG